jgi:signal transduction histidine kinase/DNA-binding response OmpR family regulator
MCSRIIVCCWLIVSPLFSFAQVVLQDSTKRVQVGRQTEVLEDKTARLTIEQVRQHADFKPSTSKDFHFGFTESAIWFRVQLRNQSQHPKWHIVLFDSYNIDYADLYLQYPDGHLDHQKGGLKRPYPNRGIVEMTPLFPVNIPTGTTVTAYIRIQSSLSMWGEVVVWEEYENLTTGRSFTVALWLFLGLFILRTLNTFVLVGFIRDWHFRFYTFCSFLLYLTNFARVGLYPILFSGQPRLMEWLLYGSIRLFPASLALWAYFLLDNRPPFKPLRWFAVGLVVAGIVGAFLPFWVQNTTISQLYSVLFLLAYPLFIVTVMLAQKARLRPPLHFLVPMMVCVALLFFAQLRLLNIITYGGVVGRAITAVLALEVVSISLVMGLIVRNYIRNQISAANALMQNKVEAANALMQNKMEVDTLREVNLLKTRFFTNISHEFRTPLTLLIGPLTDRIRQFPGDDLYHLMYRNATRLQTLINQILDLAKAEAGQLPLQLQPGDLVADVRLWVSSFDSLAESRSIRLSLNQTKTTQPATYDADKLQTILTNLVANAIKFTPGVDSPGEASPNGRQVRVEAQYDEANFRLTVADSGVGIAPDQLPHIFDRFYQASDETDNHTQTDQVGTGIGLALVNELVKLLGGTIGVESVVGEGTTFTLTLPLEVVSSQQLTNPLVRDNHLVVLPMETPSHTTPTTEIQATDNPTVLIVEDNDDMRAYIRRILAPTYTLLEAADGQQGLEMALDQMPDLIVTDWMMPRLNGIDLCRALRADPRTDHIPVVMLTAKAALEDRLDGLEIGADDYLVKPFLATELLIRLQNLLKRQQAMQHYFQRQLEHTPAPETPDHELNSQQQQFLGRVYQFLDTHLDNPLLDADLLASEFGMSNRTLHRKIGTLVAMTPGELIRTYRLRQAAQLLRSGLSPTETAYRVGFDNPSSFSRAFRAVYQKTPSEFGK